MKFQGIASLVLTFASAFAVAEQDFCKNPKHTGKSVTVDYNKVDKINDIGYELWSDGGNNSATFYEDGSFKCSFRKAKDYLCRSGLSFDSTKTHKELGHMYADFKLVKEFTQDVDYSYVGVYGWTRGPLVEYYVVDNWLSQYRPGEWVGEINHGDYTIDGAVYTVYENTRYNAPSIDGNTTFKQFFSVRKQARDCGTIDITAHFEQWEKLGLKLGKMHEAKVLGEAGNTNSGTSGTADFPYAKVYIGSKQSQPQPTTTKKTTTNAPNPTNNNNNQCSSRITNQGYKCCSDKNCEVFYVDEDGSWGVENNQWCGCNNDRSKNCVGAQGYPCCKYNKDVYFTDEDGQWSVENNDWCLIK